MKTRRTYQELVCLQMAGQLLQLMKVCTCTIYREYTVLNYGLSKQGFSPPLFSVCDLNVVLCCCYELSPYLKTKFHGGCKYILTCIAAGQLNALLKDFFHKARL